mmetsp:Transcript_7953/g.16701  ORF Transcript_7953/g.16701 Transcript_7953/m.16701 type:complete len:180 (+) Transcript_7953:411-950(+)
MCRMGGSSSFGHGRSGRSASIREGCDYADCIPGARSLSCVCLWRLLADQQGLPEFPLGSIPCLWYAHDIVFGELVGFFGLSLLACRLASLLTSISNNRLHWRLIGARMQRIAHFSLVALRPFSASSYGQWPVFPSVLCEIPQRALTICVIRKEWKCPLSNNLLLRNRSSNKPSWRRTER